MRLFPRRAGLALAAIASVTIGFMAPTPAHAAVTGTVDWDPANQGVKVKLKGENHDIVTRLFTLNLSGGAKLLTYCIDLDTDAKRNANMVEDDWKNYPNPNTNFKAQPEKVNWVLHNSYPSNDLTKLATTLGIPAIDKKAAIAGTQAAIWHYSNGAELASGNDAGVATLFNFLTGPANIGLKSEPADTLDITPPTTEGKAGENVGPFTVNTTATSVALAIAGAKDATIVNAAGEAVTTAKNGDQVFIKAPAGAAGQATITATANGKVLTGRLFRGDKVVTQTMITATTAETQVSDTAAAKWTVPAPSVSPMPSVTPSAPGKGANLPKTGSTITGVIVAGGVLLFVGVGVVFFARRRRNATVA